jgi:hypothetical protein
MVVMDVSRAQYICNILLSRKIVINLSTCNDVSVTRVAEILWMDVHQPGYWNNYVAVFLWTDLH